MPDLNFQVIGAEPVRHAAEPLLLFKLRVTETGTPPTPVHAALTIARSNLRRGLKMPGVSTKTTCASFLIATPRTVMRVV